MREYESEYEDDWREISNGNWVLLGTEGIEATVYETNDGRWGAVWNGASDGRPRWLKAKLDSADEACRAAEIAIEEGDSSRMWWPPEDQWKTSKKGSCYRTVDGLAVSVRQARSKSWYAKNAAGGFVGVGNRVSRFATEAEAQKAVDALASGRDDWAWVAPSEN
jgi:hypothetical protein